MSPIVSRTTFEMSTYVSVEISPATTTSPVVISVSQATRPSGSLPSTASRTESEIWSATLSGWPSVTDSEVKRNSRMPLARRLPGRLLDPEEEAHLEVVRVRDRVFHRGPERPEVAADLGRDVLLRQLLDQGHTAVDVDVEKAVRLVGQARCVGGRLEALTLGERFAAVLHAADTGRLVGHDKLPVDVGVVEPDAVRRHRVNGSAIDRLGLRRRSQLTLDEAVHDRLTVRAMTGCGHQRHFRDRERNARRAGRARQNVERVLALQHASDLLQRLRELTVGRIVEERVLLQAGEHVLRPVERQVEERVRRRGSEQLRLEARRRGDALEELPRRAVHDRVQADAVRRRTEPHGDPVERTDLVDIRLDPRAAVFAREVHQERTVDVRAHDRVAAKPSHRLLERMLAGERLSLGIARLLEAVDRGLLRRDHLPAAERVVDDAVRRVRLRGVGLVEHLLELRLVGWLHEHDEVPRVVLEIEPREVDLLAQRRLDVLRPVELGLLVEVALDRVDTLLLVGELAGQLVDRLPLRRARVGVDGEERGGGRRDEFARARADLV